MKIKQVYDYIDRFSPFSTQCDFDNCGLLIGNFDDNVKKIGLALDITNDVIDKAIKQGINLIITHHPVIFNPIKSVISNTPIYRLIENNISTIAVHTNLDKALGGVNDTLIEYYNLENVISPEILENLGRVGELKTSISVKEYAKIIKDNLNAKSVRFLDCGNMVKKVAYVSGSGGSMMKSVLSLGVDTFITGDIKHDQFVDAKNIGINLIEAGHYDSEVVVLKSLKKKLDEFCDGIDVVILESGSYIDVV